MTAPQRLVRGLGGPPNLTRSRFPVPPNAILGSRPAADCQRLGAAEGQERASSYPRLRGGFPSPRRGNGVLRPPACFPPDLRGRRRCAPCAMGANEDQEVRTQDWTSLSRRKSQRGAPGTPRVSFALRALTACPVGCPTLADPLPDGTGQQ